MFNKLIADCLYKNNLKKSNKEKNSFTINTALNIFYLLTNGFVIFNQGSHLVAYINANNALQNIKGFSDIENKNGYLLMPFNLENNETLFLSNDTELINQDMIIQYAKNLLATTISQYEISHNVCINQEKLLSKINTLFSEQLEEIPNNNNFSNYEKAFSACMNFLTDHKKIVLSRYIDLKNGNPIKAFLKALSLYPYAHCYLFMNKNKECFLAASPEILASFDGNTLYTTSLAGSMQASLFENIHHAVWSIKNQKEQQIVTDYIINILEKFHKEITVSLPYTFKAGPVIHIKSDISIKNISLKEALTIAQQLNPTPAVCGNPTLDAYNFLLKNEGYNREYYTGVIGYKNNNTFSFFVNLRCAKYHNNITRIYAGGGLISSSSLISEYEETIIKMKTLKEII